MITHFWSWTWRIVAGFFGLSLLIVVTAVLWIRSDTGENWLFARLQQAITTADQRITLTGASGNFPFEFHVQRIEVADKTGPYLVIDGTVLALDPWSLLRGNAHIKRIEAADIIYSRNQVSVDMKQPATPFKLPLLPLAVTIDRLNLPHIAVGEPVAGMAAIVKITGNFGLTDTGVNLNLNLTRLDQAGTFAVTGDYLRNSGKGDDQLELSLVAEEPSGKLLAGIIPDGRNRPIKVKLKGVGPIAHWAGRLDGSAGDDATVWSDMTIGRTAVDVLVSAKGNVHAASLLSDDIRGAVGGDIGFELEGQIADAGPIGLSHFRLTSAAATLSGVGRYEPKSDTITGRFDDETDLAALSKLADMKLGGQIKLLAVLSGTVKQPTAKIVVEGSALVVGDNTVGGARASIDVIGQTDGKYHFQATSSFTDTQLSAVKSGTTLTATMDAVSDSHLKDITLNAAKITGDGVNLNATGTMKGDMVLGHVKLVANDLSKFSPFIGQPLSGSLDLEGDAKQSDGKTIRTTITGQLHQFLSYIPVLDGMLAKEAQFSAMIARDNAGIVTVNDLKMTSPRSNLQGKASYNSTRRLISSQLILSILDLSDVTASLGTAMPGSLQLTANADGSLDSPTGKILLDIAHGDVSANLAASVSKPTANLVRLDNLVLTGPTTSLTGNLAIDLKTGLVDGVLAGQATNLSGWTNLLGTPLAGSASASIKLQHKKGQGIDAQIHTDKLIIGSGPQALSMDQLRLNAQLSDIFVAPIGLLTLDTTNLQSGTVALNTAHVIAESGAESAVTLEGSSNGLIAGRKFDLTVHGTGKATALQQSIALTDLHGTIGNLTTRLLAPINIDHRGKSFTLRNLNLDLGGGNATGGLAYDPKHLSVSLKATSLPLDKLAALAGRTGISGMGGFDMSLSGTPTEPQGHATLTLDQWRVDQTASLNIAFAADIDGRSVAMTGTAQGNHGEGKLDITAKIPIQFAAGFAVSLPPDGQFHGSVKGSGQLEALNQILPIGEDKIAGTYVIDLSLLGTVATPRAGGHLSLSGGRYDNAVTGMALRDISLDLTGADQRFVLKQFSATDGTGGKMQIAGSVDLNPGSEPALNIETVLTHFMATRRDDVTAMLSGSTKISGTLTAPEIAGDLTIDNAQVNIPQQLPSSIPKLDIVRIDSRQLKANQPVAPPLQNPFMAALNIKLHDHGQTFIRGNGLDSEWNGELAITGTSSDPRLVGTLNSINGTISVLGITFTVQRGTVNFFGTLDPSFDIQAEAVTSGITAIAELEGTASRPKITLSSIPILPQDEVLSRVMFGSSVGQITPTQGLQIAAAAASLASGGGPGILDRVRNYTGLDRLGFGQEPTTKVTGTGSSTPDSTVKGGKYVAPGVFVGVDQSVSGGSTRARVEVTISDHVTVDAIAGGSSANGSGSSLGLSYKRDY